MTRIAIGLVAFLGMSIGASDLRAQGAKKDEKKTTDAAPEAAPATPAADPGVPATAGDPADDAKPAPGGINLDEALDDPLLKDDKAGDNKAADPSQKSDSATTGVSKSSRYQDIVVVPRKDFLKGGRLELAPFSGLTVNDSLIRHYSFGGEITYFLTDVFGVGLQGMYFLKQQTDLEGLIGLDYNRIASLNKYIWSAALNFTYVPVYGKFALFNQHIVHWEAYASAGVGMTQSEIIPRKRSDETFKTNAITPNFGVGGRLYLLNWLTVNIAIRDYVFNDTFEPTNRTAGQPINVVKTNAEQQSKQWVNNILVYAGVGFYLPPSFSYRTPR